MGDSLVARAMTFKLGIIGLTGVGLVCRVVGDGFKYLNFVKLVFWLLEILVFKVADA